jgi:soluble P-type ATPase
MKEIKIPNFATLDLSYLVLDYNGTIAKDGKLKDIPLSSDIVCNSITDALELLLNEKRLIATLRR